MRAAVALNWLNLLQSNKKPHTNRDILTKIYVTTDKYISLASFLHVFTQFRLIFPCEYILALKKFAYYIY